VAGSRYPPLSLGGVGYLNQHRSGGGSSARIGLSGRDVKVPYSRNSFASQYAEGQALNKGVAGHLGKRSWV